MGRGWLPDTYACRTQYLSIKPNSANRRRVRKGQSTNKTPIVATSGRCYRRGVTEQRATNCRYQILYHTNTDTTDEYRRVDFRKTPRFPGGCALFGRVFFSTRKTTLNNATSMSGGRTTLSPLPTTLFVVQLYRSPGTYTELQRRVMASETLRELLP